MVNKPIKIISVVRNPSFLSGGIETYNRALGEVFSDINKYTFEEWYFASNKSVNKRGKSAPGKHKVIDIGDSFLSNKENKIRKILETKLKNNEIDIVIIHSADLSSKYLLKDKRVIKIQHFDFDDYDPKTYKFWHKVGLFFSRIIGFSTKGNVLETHANAVFFNEDSNKTKKCKNPIYINTAAPSDVKFEKIDNNGRSGGLMIARIMDLEHKGFDNLAKIQKIYNPNEWWINIYGTGLPKAEQQVQSLFGDKYKGKFDRKNVNTILNKYKYYLMTSNYEGMPITLSEAMLAGLPIIVLNTFKTISLFDKCESVFVFEKGDWEGVIGKIKEIENMDFNTWSKLSDQSIDFAKSYLSYDSFCKKWVDAVNSLMDVNTKI